MALWLRRFAPWLAVVVIALAAWRLWPTGAGASATLLDPALLLAALPSADADAARGSQAAPGAQWTPDLPRDLGPHPGSRAEVWDLTGRLQDAAGAAYGIRLTLVRVTIASRPAQRASRLAADALLLGRFELVPAAGAPITAQRASRIAAGLAGATAEPPRVWLEDWTLALGTDGSGRLEVRVDDLRLDLTLTPAKAALAPAAELLDGGAPAGRQPAARPGFRWLAQPRLALSGRLARSDHELAITGNGWLDRIWGDRLGGAAAGGIGGTRGQVALNRFLLQLDDGTELLCIHLRRRAGGGTPIPTCLASAADGETRLLQRRELTLVPAGTRWRSPADGARYPIAWQLAAPALGLDLRIDALRPDQELRFGEPVWSGAISISGERDGRPVTGAGRMDLSGYADA